MFNIQINSIIKHNKIATYQRLQEKNEEMK